MLILLFLMSMVALRAANGLCGAHRESSTVAVVYFSRMTLIGWRRSKAANPAPPQVED